MLVKQIFSLSQDPSAVPGSIEGAAPLVQQSLVQPSVDEFAGEAPKYKTLPPSVVKDIEQKNIARKLAGLPLIYIKVRKCLSCGAPFESAGNRTCGCSSRTTGMIAGREII